MSSSAKRKADERNTKLLRELTALSGNKHCFDCHQRGPTYVNMTIGAFVCTACSGILRGLNPPHRVKSMSMSSFSAEEMELLKTRGNDFCKTVWLGMYDGADAAAASTKRDGFRDDQHMRDFLILKYEKKRWYVSPAEIARQRALMPQHGSPAASSSSAQSTPPPPSNGSTAIQRPPVAAGAPVNPTAAVARTQAAPKLAQTGQTKSLDLFASDPFASPVHPTPPAPTAAVAAAAGGGGFADFANFNASPPSQSVTTSLNLGPSLIPPPGASDAVGGVLLPKSATVPTSLAQSAVPPPPPSSGGGGGGGMDKYSALAELDEIFSTAPPTAATNGLPTHAPPPPPQPAAPVNWNGATASNAWAFGGGGKQAGSVFGTSPQTAPPMGVPPQHQQANHAFPSQLLPKSSSALGGFPAQPNASFGPSSNPFFAGAAPTALQQQQQQQGWAAAGQPAQFAGGGGWPSQQPQWAPSQPAAPQQQPQQTHQQPPQQQQQFPNPFMGQQPVAPMQQQFGNWNPFLS